MRIGALVAAAIGLSACYAIDIVSPAKNAPPSVIMSLSVVHVDATEYRLDVLYTRGTDADGAARPMVDSLLLVNGEAITPFARGVLRNLEYSYVGSVPAGQAVTLMVRLPVAAGIPAPGIVELTIPARPDASEIELIEGADLELMLPADAASPPLTGPGNWRLDVLRKTGAGLFSLQGSTVPPPSFVVPASLLPVSAGDTLTTSFSRSLARDFGAALPVTARLLEFTRVQWRVSVIAAP